MISYAVQTEAMLISQKIDLPTIDGYSGEFPPFWKFPYPNAGNYLTSIHAWEQVHHLTHVCEFDLVNMEWHTHPALLGLSPARLRAQRGSVPSTHPTDQSRL